MEHSLNSEYLSLINELNDRKLLSKINEILKKLDELYPDEYKEKKLKGRLKLLQICLKKLVDLQTAFKNS